MASSISSIVNGIPVSSFPKPSNCPNNSSLFFKPSSPLNSTLLISRRSLGVKAAVIKEEEKAIVEETFQPQSFPQGEELGEPPGASSSSGLEKWVIKIEQSINIFLTDTVIQLLDALYRDRDYARFFVLETIARVPYFSFMSVLHLYETLGWWRRSDYLKVHFAESWNEMHHLLIMEELGGNEWWFDRFLSQSIAVFYYFMTVAMYMLSPRMASYKHQLETLSKILNSLISQVGSMIFGICWSNKLELRSGMLSFMSNISTSDFFDAITDHFSECVEHHAFETYDKFIKSQGEQLKQMPACKVAVQYYTEGDLYLFDEFQSSRVPNTRRPKIENLYDVFLNIRDDEAEHCKTMKACQDLGSLRSPHTNPDFASEDDSNHVLPKKD